MNMTTSERVLKMMKDLGNLDQPSFGALCGASRSVVNQWISGEIKSIGAKYAFRLQRKTGYSAEWIQLGEGSERIDGRGSKNETQPSSQSIAADLSPTALQLVQLVTLLDQAGSNADLFAATETLLRRALPAPSEAARGNPALQSLLEQYTKDPASLTPESISFMRRQFERAAASHKDNNDNDDKHDQKAGGSGA